MTVIQSYGVTTLLALMAVDRTAASQGDGIARLTCQAVVNAVEADWHAQTRALERQISSALVSDTQIS